jgi:hypothetical protein
MKKCKIGFKRVKGKCVKTKSKLKTFLVDVEEMPGEIKAKNLNEAVKIARMNLGVMEK